jgi:hypothetical protein
MLPQQPPLLPLCQPESHGAMPGNLIQVLS